MSGELALQAKVVIMSACVGFGGSWVERQNKSNQELIRVEAKIDAVLNTLGKQEQAVLRQDDFQRRTSQELHELRGHFDQLASHLKK